MKNKHWGEQGKTARYLKESKFWFSETWTAFGGVV